MLLRPHSPLIETYRLLPLGLMLGALVGLVCGAVSANLPFLVSFGPHFGRLATIWGAALGGLGNLTLLVILRCWLLKRTAFHLGPEWLLVQWPGHRAQFEWSSFIGSEHTAAGLLLHFKGGRSALLFGLRDLEQAENLVRGRMQAAKGSRHSSLVA